MSEPHLSSKPWRRRPPRGAGFHVNKDESLICKHRDLSVCPECAAAHREILEVYGNHYWMATEQAYAELAVQMQESGPPTVLVSHNDIMREARGKLAEARTPAERVEVIHDRSNVADRFETMLRRELATFEDEYDRGLILDAIEQRLAEVRKEMA